MRLSQWLTRVDFPTPPQATIVTTLTCWFAHARSRKLMSSSRPKTSLPVTGNLAMEIFFGPDLAGGFRVPTREAGGGMCCKFRRVVPRRVSIRLLSSVSPSAARLDSGIAVPDLSQGVSQGERPPAAEHLGVAQAVKARADADTSPQRKYLGTVFGR